MKEVNRLWKLNKLTFHDYFANHHFALINDAEHLHFPSPNHQFAFPSFSTIFNLGRGLV